LKIVSTIALIIGLIVVNLWGNRVGMNVDVSTLDTKGIAKYRAGQDAIDG
jgi:aerobic C4-dicarboxylate transport protein